MSSLRAVAGRALRAAPEGLVLRVAPGRLGYRRENIPAPITFGDARIRLLIAPANSAGQGRAWASAIGALGGHDARNLTVTRRGGLAFPSDSTVPDAVFAHSRLWASEHARAVRDQVTHVLVESERAVLGVTEKHDVRLEADWLARAGIARGYVSHGSDLRHPDVHADLSPWSPFRDRGWELRDRLVSLAERNAAFLRQQDPATVFVVTPDLLTDLPQATWLPNVVSPEQWATERGVLVEGRPRVVHAPTNAHLKGSDLIAGPLERLAGTGVIRYRRVEGIPPHAMPALYADADVVLDQFRIGIYSTTALEAMAAGRLVLGFLLPEVRALAERESGMSVPIVQASVDTLQDVLIDVAENPDRYRETAARGPEFVRALHDGRYSARVLRESLLSDGQR